MLGKTGFMVVPIQCHRVSTVGDTDAQQFFEIIDIGIVFAVQQGNKAEVVKFECSDGKSPRLNFIPSVYQKFLTRY